MEAPEDRRDHLRRQRTRLLSARMTLASARRCCKASGASSVRAACTCNCVHPIHLRTPRPRIRFKRRATFRSYSSTRSRTSSTAPTTCRSTTRTPAKSRCHAPRAVLPRAQAIGAILVCVPELTDAARAGRRSTTGLMSRDTGGTSKTTTRRWPSRDPCLSSWARRWRGVKTCSSTAWQVCARPVRARCAAQSARGAWCMPGERAQACGSREFPSNCSCAC